MLLFKSKAVADFTLIWFQLTLLKLRVAKFYDYSVYTMHMVSIHDGTQSILQVCFQSNIDISVFYSSCQAY